MLKDNAHRGRVVRFLILINLFLFSISSLFSLLRFIALSARMVAADSFLGSIANETSHWYNESASVIYFVIAVGVVAHLFTFLSWFLRAFQNFQALVPQYKAVPAKWVVWLWVSPVVNLYLPLVVFKQLWRGTLARLGTLAFGQHYPFVLLYVWYVFWVLGNIVGNALFGVCLAATSISEWRWVALLQLAFCTIGIVELICLYKLVKCYCGLEQNVPLLFDGCKSKGELPPMLPKV